MVPSHVQEATERKLAAAIVFGQAHNFLCHWYGKMPDLLGTRIEGVTDLSESEMKA